MTKRDICKRILWAHSVIQHERLTNDERTEFDAHMIDAFTQADALGIPYVLQNALLYISIKHDARCMYLDDMLTLACIRAGIDVAGVI